MGLTVGRLQDVCPQESGAHAGLGVAEYPKQGVATGWVVCIADQLKVLHCCSICIPHLNSTAHSYRLEQH